jgi:hypothetical protein
VLRLLLEATGLAAAGRGPYGDLVPILLDAWVAWLLDFLTDSPDRWAHQAHATLALLDQLLLLLRTIRMRRTALRRHRAYGDAMLLNPRSYDPVDLDPEARRLIAKTIAWFEALGKVELNRVHHEREWHADFLAFLLEEQVLATFLTPGSQGGTWNTARICA